MFCLDLPSIIVHFVDLVVRCFDKGDIFRITVPVSIVPPVVAIENLIFVDKWGRFVTARKADEGDYDKEQSAHDGIVRRSTVWGQISDRALTV